MCAQLVAGSAGYAARRDAASPPTAEDERADDLVLALQHGQNGRLGGATAGHHGLLWLHLMA